MVTDQEHADVSIRRLEPENLAREHGLDLKLLQPWQGLNAPFHGAWCVLRPGDVSMTHAHHEHELFIGMSGRAELVTGERRHEFAAGDIARMRPGVEHSIVNRHDEDFSYYAIWWGREMSADFLAREPGQGNAERTEAGLAT
jgi:mannose-6-phosphate isomerase-like protein (cupin superfamily)